MASKVPDNFNHYYDQVDPRAYFNALRPTGYRMPKVTCGWLRDNGGAIARARSKHRVRLVDFACGYGINGLLLKQGLSLGEAYDHFAKPAGGALPGFDLKAFQKIREQRSAEAVDLEIGGIDIAQNALDYALAVGALDATFAIDLRTESPDSDLVEFVRGTDLILETGAMGALLPPALERLLSLCPAPSLPWILLSPRPDVDTQALWALLKRWNYGLHKCNQSPVRYRRFRDQAERRTIVSAMTELGRDPEDHVSNDYVLVDLIVAVPANAGDWIRELRPVRGD